MKKQKRYKSGKGFLYGVHKEMPGAVPRSKQVRRSGTNPEEVIGGYLTDLETVHDIAYGESGSKHKIELLKKFYYSKYVLKELPESYVELQKKIAREEGRGNVEVDRDRTLKTIQANQRRSLDEWIDYLNSSDSIYPMWFKNYAFQEMVKIGKFDKEKGTFGKRSKSDTEPFVELNMEALAKVYDTVSKLVVDKGEEEKELSEEDMAALAKGNSFKKVYTHYLVQAMQKTKAQGTEGIWVKYEQGENYQELWRSLQGKNTGWCTAGERTAQKQVRNGDFYVYYTKGETGEHTEPRLAIRMNGKNQIGEVRGVVHHQNVEEEMTDILDKKLDEFPDKEAYKKRLHDMRLLTKIEEKQNKGEDLSKEEIRFLYEVDGTIQGFGFVPDSRIDEIKGKRDAIKDLVYALDGDEKYKQQVQDIKALAQIEEKQNKGEDLSKEEIRFLYEVDGTIQGFSWVPDSRMEEIKGKRDIFKDLEYMLDGDEKYKQQVQDIKTLAQIEEKQNKGEDLSKEEIRLLYGIDRKTQKVCEGLDSRIEEIKGKRDIIKDLAYALDGDEKYEQKAQDMKALAQIEEKQNKGEDLSKEEIRFLYEIDKSTQVWDTEIIPRRLKIMGKRDAIKDLAFAFDCKEEEVLNLYDDQRKPKAGQKIVVCYGDLKESDLKRYDTKDLKLIYGDARLSILRSVEGLENLEVICGNADFQQITNAKGLEKLRRIGFCGSFGSLENAEGLSSLEEIGGSANFNQLVSAKGFGNLTIKNEKRRRGTETSFSSLQKSDGAEGVKIEGGTVILPQGKRNIKEPTMLTDLIPRSKGAKLKDAMKKSADLDEKIEEAQGLLGKIKQMISEKIRRDK